MSTSANSNEDSTLMGRMSPDNDSEQHDENKSPSIVQSEPLLTNFFSQINLVGKSLSSSGDFEEKLKDQATNSAKTIANKTSAKKTRTIGTTASINNRLQNAVTHHSTKYRFKEIDGDEPTPQPSRNVSIDVCQSQSKKLKPKSKVVPPVESILKFDDCLMPPPPGKLNLPKMEDEKEANASMLMSWYMAGYHTGYYEALKKFKK